MRQLLIALIFSGLALAQTTRTVTINWSPSSTSTVTGYIVATGPASTGPWTQIGCTGTVIGSTCISGSTSSTLTYTDTEAVGTTLYYAIIAVAPACVSATIPCGNSLPGVSAVVGIGPRPATPGSTTIIIISMIFNYLKMLRLA